ncbi:MAG TPA: DNA alkylation repair protein [Candidatus Bathyarchaeia archaeon]|nr:DNA alkylation repair protein [Candidatus Bathyarchaeia archaeon]
MTQEILTLQQILAHLEENSDPDSLIGMARVGITPADAFGTKIPILRSLAKKLGKNHSLAQELWSINKRETRILACMIDDPKLVTEEQLESWVVEFSYWEICDQCILNLFEKTRFAYQKSYEWSERDEEYVKRAGFVLMARLAFSDRISKDEKLVTFIPIIKRQISDERTTVKKAISWALREMGKRSLQLNKYIIELATELLKSESKATRWVANDVLNDITRESVLQKLNINKF